MQIQTSTIQLPVKDQTAQAYLAQAKGGGPGVLVLHAWWGMTPVIRAFCDRLAEQGFTALAPDLFQGRTATTIEAADTMLGQHDDEYIGVVVGAAAKYLAGASSSQTIAVMGFSFGAAWSLVAASKEPQRVGAVVLFYGTYPMDFSGFRAKILGHFAEVDEFEPLEAVREMEAGMQAAGLDVAFYVYPRTQHWFMEEDRPQYDRAAAQLAWQRTLDFLKASI